MDINSPGFFNSFQSNVNSYATPEAAQRDMEANAPQANAEYIRHYQALKGDPFANPWDDQRSDRLTNLTNLSVRSDAGFAVGGPSGAEIIHAPSMVQSEGPNQTGTAGVPILAPHLTPDARTSALQSLLPSNTSDPLSDIPLPSFASGSTIRQTRGQPASPFSLKDPQQEAQRQRAISIGGRNLFETLRDQNPEALKSVSSTNPALQRDAKGVPIAGDVLNYHLFNDSNFQRLLQSDQPAALKFYAAITGRDLKSDMAAQGGANANRLKVRQDIIEEFAKHGDYDEFGEPFLRRMVSDGLGGQKEVHEPLGFGAKEALKQQGGLHAVLGVDAPGGPELTGVTPDQKRAVMDEAKRQRVAHPDESLQTVLLRARKTVMGVQPRPERQTVGASNASYIFRGADFFGALPNMAARGLNAIDRHFGSTTPPLQLIGGNPGEIGGSSVTQEEALAATHPEMAAAEMATTLPVFSY